MVRAFVIALRTVVKMSVAKACDWMPDVERMPVMSPEPLRIAFSSASAMSAASSALMRSSSWAASASARLVAGTHSAIVATGVDTRSKAQEPSGL